MDVWVCYCPTVTTDQVSANFSTYINCSWRCSLVSPIRKTQHTSIFLLLLLSFIPELFVSTALKNMEIYREHSVLVDFHIFSFTLNRTMNMITRDMEYDLLYTRTPCVVSATANVFY